MLQAAQNCFFLIHWKCWKALDGGAVNHNTVKKSGRMVVEQERFSITVQAPEGPAGADVGSQPSLLRARRPVNGQNKYLTVFTGTVGRWGGWTWARNSEMWIQFPAGPRDFCATWGDPWMRGCKFLSLCERFLCFCGPVIPAGDLGPDTSCPSL